MRGVSARAGRWASSSAAVALLVFSFSFSSSGAANAQSISFRNVTGESGLTALALHDGGWFGVAVAFVDLDGDLWPDLYFGGGSNQKDVLCLNQRDGRFRCQPVGATRSGGALAIAGADYDNDGDLDLYVMGEGGNRLLQNDGQGRFTDVTARTNTAGPPGSGSTATGTFFDYDGDGRYDLYLGEGSSGIIGGVPKPPQILRQNADGTFTDITKTTALAQPKNTFSMLAFDYDGDLRQDLMVTGNFDRMALYHNDGGGRFHEVTGLEPQPFQNALVEGMGLDIADFDGDGDFDIYATNSTHNPQNPGSAFFVNRGDGTFDSLAAQYGVLAAFDWGTGWRDLDNDTWPDLLAVGNLATSRFLWRNVGGTRFDPLPLPGRPDGYAESCVTAAFADYDHDGRVDVILARMDATAPELLHNETADAGQWLGVYLEGKSARDPLGALLEVRAGGRVIKQQLLSQSGKGAQSDRALHFGLGGARTADVTVTWPSGKKDELTALPADRFVSIEEGCAAQGSAWPAQCNRVVETRLAAKGPATGCAMGTGDGGGRATLLFGLVYAAALVSRSRSCRARRRRTYT